MITPKKQWTSFSSMEEKLSFYKSIGIASKSANEIPSLVYTGFYCDTPTLCDIEGYESGMTLIISINGEFHCINADYLADMQAGNKSLAKKLSQEIRLD